MKEVVSVIIPNYNHARYLRERLESVSKQDYSDMEIILLDDASSDESTAIMHAYASQDKRVRCIIKNPTNSGNPFCQWQKGIDLAQGEYIWIAESDDVAEPTLLSTLIQVMDQDPQISISCCQSDRIDQNGQPLPSRVYRKRPWKKAFTMQGKTFIHQYLLGYNYLCNASAVVMRRSAALAVSDRYTHYRASGDRQFWIEMSRQGKVSYQPDILNHFRQHGSNVSTAASRCGINTREDWDIYKHYLQTEPVAWYHRLRILLYHLRAQWTR